MFKYTFFFVIRCFASDTVPEVARCSGPKSGTERILTAVRRPFRRILRAGIFRGARSRFVRFVGSCARHSCREGRCNLFFAFLVRLAAAAGGSGAGRFPSDASFPSGLRARGRRDVLVRGPVRMCADRFAAEGPGFCRGGIRILSREDSFVSIILIYFALI